MAAVAPVLFPEMKKRGLDDGEMVSLLATAAAMSETVPPLHRVDYHWIADWRLHRRLVHRGHVACGGIGAGLGLDRPGPGQA